MPPVRWASADSGPRITVNTLLRQPTLIQERILDILDQKFIADQLLRGGGDAPGGVVQYFESPPLFAENDPEIVAEFGEIPVAMTDVGVPKFEPTRKRGLSVVISEEMRRRNQMDRVNKQIQLVKNTVIRAIDGTFMTAVLAGVDPSHVIPATAAWDAPSGTKIRADIAAAKQVIVDEKRGFNPNAMAISPTLATILEGADEVNRVFQGNIASDRPELLGKLPRQVSGLDVYVSYSVPDASPLILEAKTIGAIVDERPLSVSELYFWKRENEAWRSDTLRQSAVAIDEPLAIAQITGTVTP
jgi:hypothetical protein